MVRVPARSTTLRRFAGPVADELSILLRPEGRGADALHQAETTYRALAELLSAQGASFGDLTSETLFLRDVRRELPPVLEARSRVLSEIGQSACAPLPAFIGQAPVGEGSSFELSAWAVVPGHRGESSVRDVEAASPCGCEGCARSGARLVRLGDQRSLYTANVYGSGRDAFEQVWNMFCAAERLLDQCGMRFRDVVRTWIHLRDIDRDYEAMNKARREFFLHRGIDRRPASTGVQGNPFPDGHDFSMSLQALRSPRPLDATTMSADSLNEAWSYGADFSRGLRVVEANKLTLHVSGTASIDEAGRTAHVDDIEGQADRMLTNISSLLARQGATFENLFSGVTYLRDPSDAPVLRSLFHERGFDGFPCALVVAPLCRRELLCETEVVALLPVSTAGA